MLKNFKIADKFKDLDGTGNKVWAGEYGTVPLCSEILSDDIARVAIEAGSDAFVAVKENVSPNSIAASKEAKAV